MKFDDYASEAGKAVKGAASQGKRPSISELKARQRRRNVLTLSLATIVFVLGLGIVGLWPEPDIPPVASGSTTTSQSVADAERDGVIPELARLDFATRVYPIVEATSDEETWLLSRPTDDLINSTLDDGCALGNPQGTYPIDVICTTEYGEILLVNPENQIVRAYPMPHGVPNWIYLTEDFIYSGKVGDGALPDSQLVRINRATLDATVVLIPAPFDGGSQWPSSWKVATSEQAAEYQNLVSVGGDMTGTDVLSWIGPITVDIDGIDKLIAEVSG